MAKQRKAALLHMPMLDMAGDWVYSDEGTSGGHFPDVFDPTWAARVRRVADELCRPRAADVDLLWFIDNEMNWLPGGYGGSSWIPFPGANTTQVDSLLLYFLCTNSSSPGHAHARAFLQARYTSVSALASDWKLGAAVAAMSWPAFSAAVASLLPIEKTAARTADGHAWFELVATSYFETTTREIRRADPNHLIVGPRYSDNPPSVAGPIAGRSLRQRDRHFPDLSALARCTPRLDGPPPHRRSVRGRHRLALLPVGRARRSARAHAQRLGPPRHDLGVLLLRARRRHALDRHAVLHHPRAVCWSRRRSGLRLFGGTSPRS